MKKIFLKLVQVIILLAFLQCHYYNPNKRDMTHKLNFYTQYNQFYISSDNAKSIVSGNNWDDKALQDRLGILKNTLVVNTESYGDIKGEVIVLEKPNTNIKFDSYDHIVEGGLEIESGVLDILDCPNTTSQLKINLNPGKYRIRIYSSNLDSVEENDLANDDDNDFYKIEIWPDENMECKVLKKYVRK
jgi:hypothetical protein